MVIFIEGDIEFLTITGLEYVNLAYLTNFDSILHGEKLLDL